MPAPAGQPPAKPGRPTAREALETYWPLHAMCTALELHEDGAGGIIVDCSCGRRLSFPVTDRRTRECLVEVREALRNVPVADR